ncbi:MAG: aromatic ring-hydroxylating dioxygenase subunit alpha [Polyangiaceae bacterium]
MNANARNAAPSFPGFADVWTPVALSSEVTDTPFPVVVAGTRVVLFRDAKGIVAALLDRCPHRGVALSLGRVNDGCIECPFHGWRLDRFGSVAHVPWNPDAKVSKLGGVALPTRERAGQIFLYTGLAPESEPLVSDKLEDPRVRVSGTRVEWACHWTRAMENMLDWAHLPFVHRKTIGKALAPRSSGRLDIHWEETPYGATSHIEVDGKPEAGRLEMRWPNQMNLFIPIPGRSLVLAVACVPRGERSTTMLLFMARSFLKSPLLDPLFNRKNIEIAEEDRAIVESSDPGEVPPAALEQSVRTDALTLHFRKRYDRELRAASERRSLMAAEA